MGKIGELELTELLRRLRRDAGMRNKLRERQNSPFIEGTTRMWIDPEAIKPHNQEIAELIADVDNAISKLDKALLSGK